MINRTGWGVPDASRSAGSRSAGSSCFASRDWATWARRLAQDPGHGLTATVKGKGSERHGQTARGPHRPWGPAGPWSIKHRSRAWCPSSEGCLLRPQAIAIPISRCPFCRGENGGSSTLGERGSELCPSSSRAVFSNTTQAGSARGHSPRPTYQLHRQQTEPCQGQAQGRSA